MAKKSALVSLLLLAALPAGAGVKASGYLKSFWQYSHSALDRRAYNLSTSRGRLTLDGEAGVLRGQVSYDHQVAAGSYFRTTEFRLFGYAPPKPWLDMEGTISTGTTNGYGHGVFRGWVGVETDDFVVRAGRQRVAWGTGKLWNPTDVFNPYQPVTVERDERRGADALYGRAPVGELGQAELVWAPQENWPEHALVARGRGNWAGWDASLLGGKVAGSTGSLIVGGDFAGTVLDGTLHGELAYFSPEVRTPYWKAGLGWDYTFPNDASLVVEWYHAGNGQDDRRRYDFASLRSGREVGVGRDYAGGSLSHDLHTLVKAEAVGVANARDASTFFYPSLAVNPLEDLWLTAAWQRFGGERTTEFGRQPNQVVVIAQYWF
ncbi:MAG: hypothetical protein SF051_07045 [Elusimicrobiota bacterium]|nr:hypothetical protein [Elusimicrobiota bacterium]